MSLLGYARVSTVGQSLDRQIDALKDRGCEKVFEEKVSGVAASRPELARLLEYAREGDTVVVESYSRLARSTVELLRIVDTLREKGVQFISMKENTDTQTPAGRLFLTVMAGLSQFERDVLLERQKEGIAAAKQRGKPFGRPRTEFPENWPAIYRMWKKGDITAVSAMQMAGMTKPTFYRCVKRWEAEAKERAS